MDLESNCVTARSARDSRSESAVFLAGESLSSNSKGLKAMEMNLKMFSQQPKSRLSQRKMFSNNSPSSTSQVDLWILRNKVAASPHSHCLRLSRLSFRRRMKNVIRINHRNIIRYDCGRGNKSRDREICLVKKSLWESRICLLWARKVDESEQQIALSGMKQIHQSGNWIKLLWPSS